MDAFDEVLRESGHQPPTPYLTVSAVVEAPRGLVWHDTDAEIQATEAATEEALGFFFGMKDTLAELRDRVEQLQSSEPPTCKCEKKNRYPKDPESHLTSEHHSST
eukprot:scaffold434_cov186-Pinguiococcus_pyrenoidosus.AAC.66